MFWTLLSALAHHGEHADPTLMGWIKNLLDAVFGLGPWPVVLLLGLVIVLAPISVVVFYLLNSRASRPVKGNQP